MRHGLVLLLAFIACSSGEIAANTLLRLLPHRCIESNALVLYHANCKSQTGILGLGLYNIYVKKT